ncbi:MAG: hypothetical protein F6J95_019115 [Leptolyngbya sp. SIO1E4]|nr:hypothetical protein [Leptolyngbya sp. SIO1E4]
MKIRTLTFLPLLVAPVAPFMLTGVAAAAPLTQVKQATVMQVVTQTDETLYLDSGTIYELPMVVESAVVVNGLNLPAGTVINGRLEPVEGGLRYVATEIEGGGLRTTLNATSDVLHDVKDPRETSAGSTAVDAAIGAAGGAVIGAVLGDGISLLEVLGGAATGVLVGNVTAQRVVIIEAGKPIELRAE